jgi:hypothetical protein
MPPGTEEHEVKLIETDPDFFTERSKGSEGRTGKWESERVRAVEEDRVTTELTKPRMRCWRTVAMMALAYVAAYFAFMARNVPAVDDTGRVAFKSSFRMAPGAGRSGLVQTYRVTWLNYVFYPLDAAYYAVAPADVSLNTLP